VVSEDTGQQQVAELAAVARRYLQAIDSREGKSPQDFLISLHPLLCELTYRASLLPDLDLEDDEDEVNERADVAVADTLSSDEWVETWRPLYHSLQDFLGTYDLYWSLFDPVEPPDDAPYQGSLADDLAEIYCDLTSALICMAQIEGQIPVEVLWDWRFDFFSHWGEHAINATRTIHALMSYHDLGEVDDEDEDAAESA